MTRAGREPAEDVARRMVAALQAAGLVVKHRTKRLTVERDGRVVIVTGSHPGWQHECQMMEVSAFVDLAGTVSLCRVNCTTTDDDPVQSIWMVPMVNDWTILLDELPNVVRVIVRERGEIIRMMAEGKKPPFPGLHWPWEVPKGFV